MNLIFLSGVESLHETFDCINVIGNSVLLLLCRLMDFSRSSAIRHTVQSYTLQLRGNKFYLEYAWTEHFPKILNQKLFTYRYRYFTVRYIISVAEPEPPFLAAAVKKGAAPAPALQLKLQL